VLESTRHQGIKKQRLKAMVDLVALLRGPAAMASRFTYPIVDLINPITQDFELLFTSASIHDFPSQMIFNVPAVFETLLP